MLEYHVYGMFKIDDGMPDTGEKNQMWVAKEDLSGITGWNEKLAAYEAALKAEREAGAPAQA